MQFTRFPLDVSAPAHPRGSQTCVGVELQSDITLFSILVFAGCTPMRPGSTFLLCLVVFAVALNAVATAHADEPAATNFVNLVHQLDHPAFHTRQAAARALIAAGIRSGDDSLEQVTTALHAGLEHPAIEVRMAAAETLREIDHIRHEQQTDRLLNPRCAAATIQLAGWQPFSKLAGDDLAARRLFATLSHHYAGEFRGWETRGWETGGCELRGGEPKGPSPSLRRLTANLDPYRLSPEDAIGWTMLVWMDIESRRRGDDLPASRALPHALPSPRTPQTPRVQQSSRLSTALSNPPMGPKLESEHDAEVLRRLIRHWVLVPDRGCPTRERLLIAMRFQCRDSADQLCTQVFADPAASPSTQVTALLSASALGSQDIEAQAAYRLGDDRTAHVWQLIASRRKRIRTQVRDVALAVLLHHYGIDPRRAGFVELQADPLLVFRDHSLGFPDESSRQASFTAAKGMLPATHSP